MPSFVRDFSRKWTIPKKEPLTLPDKTSQNQGDGTKN